MGQGVSETETTVAALGIEGAERKSTVAGTRSGSHPPRFGRALRTDEGVCRTEAVLSRMSNREEPAQRHHGKRARPGQTRPNLDSRQARPCRPHPLSSILCPKGRRANCLSGRAGEFFGSRLARAFPGGKHQGPAQPGRQPSNPSECNPITPTVRAGDTGCGPGGRRKTRGRGPPPRGVRAVWSLAPGRRRLTR